MSAISKLLQTKEKDENKSYGTNLGKKRTVTPIVCQTPIIRDKRHGIVGWEILWMFLDEF